MSTREERYAAHIAELRALYPNFGDEYWEEMADRRRLQWQLDDLGNGIAELAGKYGFHVDQDPGNVRLAALVDELRDLNRVVSGSREGADR